ncbi:hypothetical protein C8A05DRAFT_19074, partial [Staphylotrichum tortipilum]
QLTLERLRQKLDAGLGSKLIRRYRRLEHTSSNQWEKHAARYTVILLGALLMGTGARIKDGDLQHLRQLTLFANTGLHGPAKKQFLAALDNYQPGTPRNFMEASCYNCGKTCQDTEKALLRCAECTDGFAWFCDEDCHQNLWTTHEPNCCAARRNSRMLDI